MNRVAVNLVLSASACCRLWPTTEHLHASPSVLFGYISRCGFGRWEIYMTYLPTRRGPAFIPTPVCDRLSSCTLRYAGYHSPFGLFYGIFLIFVKSGKIITLRFAFLWSVLELDTFLCMFLCPLPLLLDFKMTVPALRLLFHSFAVISYKSSFTYEGY